MCLPFKGGIDGSRQGLAGQGGCHGPSGCGTPSGLAQSSFLTFAPAFRIPLRNSLPTLFISSGAWNDAQ